jgi:DNA-binding MurR/RpiR family transcriptional regulator
MAPAQRRLACYLIEHLSTAPDLTITDLAEEAGVSVGTVSQLCRRLGLRGYQDLRLGIAREAVSVPVSGRVGPAGTETDSPGPFASAVDRVFGAGVEALTMTARQLDPGHVSSAVDLIARARRVEWVGVGSAGLVAAEGALKLRKLGIDSVSHIDGHQQVMSAALLGDQDVLVVVSHSGRTTDVLESVQVARERGAIVLAITGVAASPLARQAHVVLPTVSYDTAFQVEPMASMLAQLAMVQMLFLVLLEAGGSVAEERLARTQQALESRHVRGRLR